jgi:hypothetical protein
MADQSISPAQTVRERLKQFNLHLNEPEPVIICCTCQFALSGSAKCIVDHVVDKHKYSKDLAKDLGQLLRPYTILGPKELRLRANHTPPHPHLSKHLGMICKHCGHKTTSAEILARHLSKEHGMKRKTSTWLREHGVNGVMLQSWDRNGAYGYWTIKDDRSPAASSSTSDNSLLQESASRLQRLEQLHLDERERLISSRKVTNDIGSCDMALNTNWMRRTGWAETFAGADRKLLVQLAQIPRDEERNLALGIYDGIAMYSSSKDECQLSYLVTALDRGFDRCEDTVRHTDVSIRCLLRSSYPDRTYKAPFELVGRKATTEGYRRLFKKAVCFCVRFWRLNPAVRQKLLQRSLTDAQDQSLRELWCDDAWAAMRRVQEAESHRREPSPEAVSPMDDVAWLSEDCFEDMGSTYTDSSDEELGELEEVPRMSLGIRDRSQQDRTRLSSNRYRPSNRSLNQAHKREDVQVPDATLSAEWPIPLEDPLLRFVEFLSTEEYENGKPSSTLLIYISGILGISHDGSTFERAKNYTSKLSALIYCIRMIILEATLPRFAHDRLGWKARPRFGQIDILNEIRRRTLCLGSPAPMNELLSLRDYGRVISRSDGPSFRVTWSEDSQIVSWDDQHLSMSQFRQVGQDPLQATAAICSQLMYGWSPQIDLSQVHDDLSCNTAGYSFVTAPANGLLESYLELSRRASLATVNGLTTDNDWDHKALRRYLDQYVEMTSSMMLLVVLMGGQAPRITELSALEHCNGPSTTRGVCAYAGKIGLIFRHAKSRRTTNNEFIVVRFLPEEAGKILYCYLVYIRPFACMLHRVCLETEIESTLLFSLPSSPREPVKTYTLTKALTRQTTSTLGFPLSVKIYRQVSIAVTEKHVQDISRPFNQYDDRSKDADINVVFAWQSGHRPLQRGTTYGIDGAFPDSLQPALLRIYEWASDRWHKFLQLRPANPSNCLQTRNTQKRGPSSSVDHRTPKRHRTAHSPENRERPPLQDEHTLPKCKENKASDSPWATATEAAIYKTAPKVLWPGSLPILGRPTPLEREDVIKERKMISIHISHVEAQLNRSFQSRRRLLAIDQAFVRWRNVGCQLCYASTGEYEPDHDLEQCSRPESSEKARKIFTWLQDLEFLRLVDGLGACSLYSMTNCPCGDVIAGIRLYEADRDAEKKYWRGRLSGAPYGDGECQNKPVVKRTSAALCAYDDQILGKYLSERLCNDNGVDPMAQNLVALWFERLIPLDRDKVLRLLFVFEMLVFAFDFRRSRSAAAQCPDEIGVLPCLYEQGWDDDDEVEGWKNAISWWVGKCGFCAGRGLQGSKIKHSLSDCTRGGARQRSIRVGEAIFGQGFKARGGCARCGVPREFCDRWAKSSDGHWQLQPLRRCQYGRTVYDTVVGLFQCSEPKYAEDLLVTIEEEGEEDYCGMGDEEVSMWLCRKLVVSGVESTEMMRQLWVWTRMVFKAHIQ